MTFRAPPCTSTAIVLTREELKEMSKNVKELKGNNQYTVVTWQNIHNVSWRMVTDI